MPTLDPHLRDQLATVIGNKEKKDGGARAVAVAGAQSAIEALAVHLSKPHEHHKNDPDKARLRNRLRARARQLGDVRRADGSHEIDRLVEQTAYEHWHRMLFARFLAENDLLFHPEMKAAVTLEECAELAPSEGAADAWELAGRYASRMLPQIFRPSDPVLALRFAAEHQLELERLLASLPAELFRASDSLGWVYQFWQARRKKEVNASEVEIGADELPAVTQLFTEPYMVQFLLHNTLGAWWAGAGRQLPLEMPYLRLLDDGTPAAGTFKGWPRHARELKVLDPCCGSGHFLVAAFEILVAFRMAEEGSSARDACDAVLRDNLFGLELDYRCVQIAAFALALAAWTYPDAGGYRPLAPMNVACSGLAISAKKEEWEALAGDDLRLRNGMGRMWELFKDSPVAGSLVEPSREPGNPLLVARFDEVRTFLTQALSRETKEAPEEWEIRVAASGLAEAGLVLAGEYHLVATNVPYLTWGNQGPQLQRVTESSCADGKTDLATVFLARCLRFVGSHGSTAVVVPQNWLYQDYYRAYRSGLLRTRTFRVAAWLGPAAFGEISGEVVKPALMVIDGERPDKEQEFITFDAHDLRTPEAKAEVLRGGAFGIARQAAQLANPKSRVLPEASEEAELLSDYADYSNGIQSGDSPRFVFRFWEVESLGGGWAPQQSTVKQTTLYGGMTNAFFWQEGAGQYYRFVVERLGEARTKSWIRGADSWRKKGVAISATGAIRASLYTGELFDDSTMVLIPKDPRHLPAIWAFCSSDEYERAVRKVDKKLNVRGALLAVPFDLAHWEAEAHARYPRGLPAPATADPTQWIFSGQPRTSDAPLQVAVARLLGYRWPGQQPDALDSLADKDGIVCIPAVRGERPAADRLTDLLAAAWGKDWHPPQTLTDLLGSVGHAGNLEEWLRDDFFDQHCTLFQDRPFIWHLWDGHREGFSVLVNYHKLDHELLKSLTYTYLGDWIRNQELEAQAGKSGAGDKLAKAKALQQRLAAILEGEAPFDIFVRWKPLEQQPIGWHPDLDDGVRLNIRPFMTVLDVGAKGAGALRWKPNIKWGKDRGKNSPGSPWGEDRDNDEHLKLSEKRKAREAV